MLYNGTQIFMIVMIFHDEHLSAQIMKIMKIRVLFYL
jgi:hypothetical protein